MKTLLPALIVLCMLGCDDQGTTASDADTGLSADTSVAPDGFDTASEPTPNITFDTHLEGRYCEVLIAHRQESGFVADVWSSIGFGSCPQEQWEALDNNTLKADFPDAAFLLLNGPRFFLMQEIYVQNPAESPRMHTFGSIGMMLAATVTIDPSQTGPYRENYVARETTFRFKAGSRIFELLSPEGAIYVMQSFSRIEDPDLTFDDLSTLGERLMLPEGWTFNTRILDADLDVYAYGEAAVIQDPLSNSYQRLEAPR